MKKALLILSLLVVSITTFSQQILQGFESGTFPPTGWAESHTGIDALNQSTDRVYSGTYSAFFNDVSSVDTSRLTTDTILSLNPASQLTFWQNQNFGSYYEYHAVWISVNGAPAFELDSLGAGTEDVWEEKVIDLSAYAGMKVALTFVYFGDFADEWYLDDIKVDLIPTCPDLSSISTYFPGTDSVNVTWLAGLNDSAWVIQYDTNGFPLGTGMMLSVGNDSATISGLTQNTTYQVYVRNVCSLGDSGNWIGPISFTSLATCPSLTSPYAYSTGKDSTNLTWLAGANDTAWQIEYGTSGFAQGTGMVVNNSNDSITLNGLMSGTTYDVYFRGVCGIGDTGLWVGPVSFTTLCDFYVAPWTEEFNTTTPNCFTETGDNAWEYGSNVTTPSGFADYGADNVPDYSALGGGTFIGMDGSDNIDGDTSVLETPLVDVSGLAIPALSYAVFSNNVDDTAQNKLIVEFFDGATWNSIDTIQANLGSNWVWMEHDLSSYSVTGNVQARFTVIGISNGGSTYYNDILLDNISFNKFITCPDPDSLTVISVGVDSIVFDFTPGASDSTWIVEYDTTGFTPGTGNIILVNNDTVIINGLGADTTYDIYLRSVCTLGDSSNWIGPLTVTTLADCPAPTNIIDFLLARDSNNLTWTNGAFDSLWHIEFDTTGFAIGTGKDSLLTNDSITLLGLTPNTTYDFYVRSICTSLDTSGWVGPYTFTTLPSCPTVNAVADYYTTDDSTNIVIVSGPYDSTWQVEYGVSGFVLGTGTFVNSPNDTLAVNGLTANTTYDVYVRSICSVGDSSVWFGPYSFTTLCAVYTPAYLEDYTTFLPTCWEDGQGSLTTNSVITYGTSDWSQLPFGNVGSDDAANLNLWSSSQREWLFSPTIDLGNGSNPYILEFDIALTPWGGTSPSSLDADDRIAIVISEDNGLTWSDTNILVDFNSSTSISNTGDHILYDLSADGYTGLVKFAIYAESKVYIADNDVFIDNFAINPKPACLQATTLGTFDIGTDSAYLFWSGSASDSLYIVEYGPAGFTPGTGTVITSTNDTALVTGLMPNSSYQFYVTTVCNLYDTSIATGPATFGTDLENPTACGINRAIADGACGAGNVFDINVPTAPGNMLGTNVILKEVRLIIEHTWVSDLELRLVSPSGDTTDLSIGNGGAGVNYGDTAGSCTQYTAFNMDALNPITGGSAPFIGQYIPEGNFADFNDNSSPVGVWKLIACDVFTPDAGTLQYLELVFDLPPTCPKPTNLVAYGAGIDSINLTWTPGINDSVWIIEYGPVGFTQGTGTTVNSNNDSITINGLVADQEYDFYLRSICHVGDSSIWVGPAVDTTLPVCLRTVAFTVLNSDSTSINLGWNLDPSQTDFVIEYGPVGFTPGTGTTASVSAPTNFYQATGLSPQTTYDFYIRAVCLSGDSSNWDGPFQGTTGCSTQPLPWSEGFENQMAYGAGEVPMCWLADGDWETDTNSNSYNRVARTDSAYLFTDWSANDWVFTPYFKMDPSGVYQITFWYITDGNTGWDSVRVGVGNNQTSSAMTEIIHTEVSPTQTSYKQVKAFYKPTIAGTYTFGVHVTADFNPWYITFDDFGVDDTTNWIGINELASQESFEIYPNPNNGNFNIKNFGNSKNTNVSILDIQGRAVLSEKMYFTNGTQKQINLSKIERGVYVISISYNGVSEQHRVIIE